LAPISRKARGSEAVSALAYGLREAMRARQRCRNADITVFGAEPHPNYNRILLSPVLAGEQTFDDIVLNPFGCYETNGVRLHLGKAVARIDRTGIAARRRSARIPGRAPRPRAACRMERQ
jgi:hypothetical protein